MTRLRRVAILAAVFAVAVFALQSEAADPPSWWDSATVYKPGGGGRQSIIGGWLPDGGVAPIRLDSSGNVMTSASAATCANIVQTVLSCGTTPLAVPTTRTAGSTSLEIGISTENAGSPKVKCIVDPADGGVGFGATYPGMARSPVEPPMYFLLDSTHTVICVCDTPAMAVTTAECVP